MESTILPVTALDAIPVTVNKYLPRTVLDKDGVERELLGVSLGQSQAAGGMIGLSYSITFIVGDPMKKDPPVEATMELVRENYDELFKRLED